jgi:hypothetical protein
MGFEASPRNEFRASLRPGGRRPIVVAEKNAKVDRSADGLEAVQVPRAEKRRTDQRGGDRHRLEGEQSFVRHKGKKHAVDLVNLSDGGAMVAGQFKARLWDKVDLVLGEGAEMECAVRWIRDGEIGLEFAHETRIDCDPGTRDALLREVLKNSFPDVEFKARAADAEAEEKLSQKRDAPRHPLIWNGVLHHDFQWQSARLRNISATGALVECANNVPVGAVVFLDLKEAGRVAATVSWSRGDQTGLLFAEPFDVTSLSKATPILASKGNAKPAVDPQDSALEPSPWAPEWQRLSVDELGAELGG